MKKIYMDINELEYALESQDGINLEDFEEEDEDIENKEEWIKVIPIGIREKNNKVIGYGYKK